MTYLFARDINEGKMTSIGTGARNINLFGGTPKGGRGDACGPTYFHTAFNKGGRRFLAAMMVNR